MGSTFDGDNRRLMTVCFREERPEILQLRTSLVSVATQGTTGRAPDRDNQGLMACCFRQGRLSILQLHTPTPTLRDALLMLNRGRCCMFRHVASFQLFAT